MSDAEILFALSLDAIKDLDDETLLGELTRRGYNVTSRQENETSRLDKYREGFTMNDKTQKVFVLPSEMRATFGIPP